MVKGFKIGDVVRYASDDDPHNKFVITHIDEETDYISGIGLDGHPVLDKDSSYWVKTGEYCPDIKPLLESLKTFGEDTDLKIGDVVRYSENGKSNGRKFVVTRINFDTGYTYISGIGPDGNQFSDKNPHNWVKTGEYCPMVNDLLDYLQTLKD